MTGTRTLASWIVLLLLASYALRADEPGDAPKADQKKPACARPQGIKLGKPNPPNVKRNLQNGTRDLSTLFVEFTPAGRKPIKAQVYIVLNVPPEQFNRPDQPRLRTQIRGRGHEVESFPENVMADLTLDATFITEIEPSRYCLDLGGIEYLVTTTDKGKLPNQPREEGKSAEKPKPIEKGQSVEEGGQAPRDP